MNLENVENLGKCRKRYCLVSQHCRFQFLYSHCNLVTQDGYWFCEIHGTCENSEISFL